MKRWGICLPMAMKRWAICLPMAIKMVAKSLTYYIYTYLCTYPKQDVSHNHRFLKFRGSHLRLYIYPNENVTGTHELRFDP